MNPINSQRLKVLAPILLALFCFCLMTCAGPKEPSKSQRPPRTQVTKKASPESLPGSDKFVPAEIQPKFVVKVAPVYPRAALQAGIEGKVVVKILIDKRGEVRDAILVRGTGVPKWGFEESALDAARRCKFTPAIQQGKPVAIWVTFPFEFKLKK